MPGAIGLLPAAVSVVRPQPARATRDTTSEASAADSPADEFLEDAHLIVCAIGFARSAATEQAGSPGWPTVLGHSAGASLGASVALAAEFLEPIDSRFGAIPVKEELHETR